MKWNEITWYSRLGVALLCLGVIPALAFCIGVKYGEVKDLYNEIPVDVPVQTAQKKSPGVMLTGDDALYASLTGEAKKVADEYAFYLYQIEAAKYKDAPSVESIAPNIILKYYDDEKILVHVINSTPGGAYKLIERGTWVPIDTTYCLQTQGYTETKDVLIAVTDQCGISYFRPGDENISTIPNSKPSTNETYVKYEGYTTDYDFSYDEKLRILTVGVYDPTSSGLEASNEECPYEPGSCFRKIRDAQFTIPADQTLQLKLPGVMLLGDASYYKNLTGEAKKIAEDYIAHLRIAASEQYEDNPEILKSALEDLTPERVHLKYYNNDVALLGVAGGKPGFDYYLLERGTWNRVHEDSCNSLSGWEGYLETQNYYIVVSDNCGVRYLRKGDNAVTHILNSELFRELSSEWGSEELTAYYAERNRKARELNPNKESYVQIGGMQAVYDLAFDESTRTLTVGVYKEVLPRKILDEAEMTKTREVKFILQ